MSRPRWFLVILLLSALGALLTGCGGSSGSDLPVTGDPATGFTYVLSVDWPARTRSVDAPRSASLARITIVGAGTGGTNLVTDIPRGTRTDAFQSRQYGTGRVRPGSYGVQIQFYSGSSATTDVVATANDNISMSAEGAFPIPAVTLQSRIASVVVTPGQARQVGETAFLEATARDSTGRILAVAPGSFSWSLLQGADILNLSANGSATGAAIGLARIRAEADGVVSASADLPVAEPIGTGCGVFDYSPSYANVILNTGTTAQRGQLRYWDAFPVRYNIVKGTGWNNAWDAMIETSLQRWVTRTSGDVTWVAWPDQATADVTIRIVAPNAIPGQDGSTAGLASSTVQGRRIVSVAVYVANTLDFPGEMDSVLTHELGHALGIGGHSDSVDDLMYFAVTDPPIPNPTLRDFNTLRTAYCDNFVSGTRRPLGRGPIEVINIRCRRHVH